MPGSDGNPARKVVLAAISNRIALFDAGDDPCVYFVHSYCMADVSDEWTAATCTYGQTFTAAICRGNVMATQFHPEKSGEAGLKMLKRFAEWKGASAC